MLQYGQEILDRQSVASLDVDADRSHVIDPGDGRDRPCVGVGDGAHVLIRPARPAVDIHAHQQVGAAGGLQRGGRRSPPRGALTRAIGPIDGHGDGQRPDGPTQIADDVGADHVSVRSSAAATAAAKAFECTGTNNVV